ncbi:DUF2332 family protein [Neorhizobium sp. CSC1952]|uniref:DUF2332 domain-containing protein n=1 Tax=Neorhizobium sp. CSC1952 TaxID=2978974 RepID=UPI0025A56AAD|nr:DUF2332 family protein [Rhizobium sp. CSC1952]WJR65544.1 DUF2332 family protein [Rhizobium sp. CSC1952]
MASEAEILQAFRDQAVAGNTLGSPFTARLCTLAAERLDRSTTVSGMVLNWEGDPGVRGDLLPARLAGALHALVLDGRDDALKSVYPPNAASDDALWSEILRAFNEHEGFILERLRFAPQTNEVRRSSALLAGFLAIADLFGKPLILSEFGASMGLNLNWDRYHHDLGGLLWGDPASPVRLRPDWQGPPPPRTEIAVQDRAGCDLNPLDPHSPEDTSRLLSYLWADQADRVERTRAALEIARANRVLVEKGDALVWLKEKRLAQRTPGAVHVVYHSIAWQYLPPEARAKGEAIIAEAGARATEEAPLARLQMEADGNPDGVTLSLQVWPTGEAKELGRTDPHGRWVKWKGWKP